ncbi:hypothetical protein AB0J63_43335 [Streptosporangium canum]
MTSEPFEPTAPFAATASPGGTWMSPGVAGIGSACFLADVGHEIPAA